MPAEAMGLAPLGASAQRDKVTDHHQNAPAKGPILWKLLVFAQSKG